MYMYRTHKHIIQQVVRYLGTYVCIYIGNRVFDPLLLLSLLLFWVKVVEAGCGISYFEFHCTGTGTEAMQCEKTPKRSAKPKPTSTYRYIMYTCI